MRQDLENAADLEQVAGSAADAQQLNDLAQALQQQHIASDLAAMSKSGLDKGRASVLASMLEDLAGQAAHGMAPAQATTKDYIALVNALEQTRTNLAYLAQKAGQLAPGTLPPTPGQAGGAKPGNQGQGAGTPPGQQANANSGQGQQPGANPAGQPGGKAGQGQGQQPGQNQAQGQGQGQGTSPNMNAAAPVNRRASLRVMARRRVASRSERPVGKKRTIRTEWTVRWPGWPAGSTGAESANRTELAAGPGLGVGREPVVRPKAGSGFRQR